MGYSHKGRWFSNESWKLSGKGEFVRDKSIFRHHLSAECDAQHPIETNRYHLYVSRACPWAHRVMIVRALLGLEDWLPVSFVHPLMHDKGWTFQDPFVDELTSAQTLHEIYLRADPQYTGRVTVPILFDKESQTIVNNESSEIIRMLHQFAPRTKNRDLELYPKDLQAAIDQWNDDVYTNLNNGVYKCGFATTQDAYTDAVTALFNCLSRLEQHLTSRRYLVGNQITEADIRLFPTLIRFDAVYHGHFKCNLKKLSELPALHGYLKRLHAIEGLAATCDLEEIKAHYYGSHLTINPTGIIPAGPIAWP